ncbi:MAG: phage holin [Clostridia bacterium]|nr:phage holin [Clostridia bacterium]
MINWKVRFKNKNFWIAFVSALGLLTSYVLDIFGIKMDFSDLVNKIIKVIEGVFQILVIWGVIVDPTTSGTGDSNRALTYDTPYKD